MRGIVWVLMAAVLVLAACVGRRGTRSHRDSGDEVATDGGTRDAPIETHGGVGLRVTSYRFSRSIAGYAAEEGHRLVVTSLELANDEDAAAATPLVYGLFSAEVSSGLVFSGSYITIYVDDGCPQDASVAPGASVSCVVVFGIPDDQDPVHLFYVTTAGDRASADFPDAPEMTTACATPACEYTDEAYYACRSEWYDLGEAGCTGGACGECTYYSGGDVCDCVASMCDLVCQELVGVFVACFNANCAMGD